MTNNIKKAAIALLEKLDIDGSEIGTEVENLRESLAQPEQEPLAYRSRWRNTEGQIITGWVVHLDTTANPDPRQEIEPLYTTPPQRKLTDKQREEIAKGWRGRNWTLGDIIDAIEAAHNIKE